jgi:hypothetical protein
MPSTLIEFRVRKPLTAPDWQLLSALLIAQKFRGLVMAPEPGAAMVPGEPLWQIKFDASETTGPIVSSIAQLLQPLSDALQQNVTSHSALPDGASSADLEIDDAAWAGFLQVYRQLDDAGHFTRDVLVDAMDAPLPGLVLLQRVWVGDRWTGRERDAQHRQRTIALHQAAMPKQGVALAVVDRRSEV